MSDDEMRATIYIEWLGGVASVDVPALPTKCPQLVITPSISNEGGSFTLTHLLTGRRIMRGNHVVNLHRLAEALIDCGNWSFNNPQFFELPDSAEMFEKVLKVTRDWENENRPVLASRGAGVDTGKRNTPEADQ